jgi:protein-disulfide isomerase
MRRTPTMLLLLCLLPAGVEAAPCDRLSASQRALSQKIQRATYPYDCCDETLERCLKQKKVCKLAKRLRDQICRMLLKGKDEKQIGVALDQRARSMTPMGKPAVIDLAGAPAAGEARAPVTVVAYACARCPFCSKVLPDLHALVTAGQLKGKVKLYFKPFPIRGHKHSVEGGLALVAAEKLGQLWPYMLKLYGNFDRFAVDKLVPWAVELGLDRGAFERAMKDGASRTRLVQSKKEGLRNGVKATPTLFINGRHYHGELDHDTLLDVLGEEVDRVSKRRYCGGP